jgi:hypothetical protein
VLVVANLPTFTIMKPIVRFRTVAVIILAVSVAHGQTETFFVGRMGMQTAATYHLAEVLQSRGRWLFPDVAYIDFAKNDYREVLVGAGLTTYRSKRLTLMNGGYFDAASGSAAKSAKYILSWTDVQYLLTERFGSETYFVAYLPLNGSGMFQTVLERAKLEYEFCHFKLGVGYAGYQSQKDPWQSRPLLTTTLKAGNLGDLEFWLQRLPENKVQAQIRYVLGLKSHKH